MHFEVLVEDQSGSIALDVVLEKILGANGANHSWRLHRYRGIGRVPKNLHTAADPRKRLLLDQLPRLLRGYGRSLDPRLNCVVVVVDLDDRDCRTFKHELLAVLHGCNPRPRTLFRIAIEEGEAWLLGDRRAVKAAYPAAADTVLHGYRQGQHLRYMGGPRRRRSSRRICASSACRVPDRGQGEVRVGRANRAAHGREREPGRRVSRCFETE